MSITSEKVLRKMNEIQSKGGPSIGHWHQLRRWLLENEQVQETFQEAVQNDPDMSDEQKAYWLSQTPKQIDTSGAGELVDAVEHLLQFKLELVAYDQRNMLLLHSVQATRAALKKIQQGRLSEPSNPEK